MKRDHSKLRTLLFQIRDEPSIRREEHESFVRYSGLSHEQIDVLNVFDRPYAERAGKDVSGELRWRLRFRDLD